MSLPTPTGTRDDRRLLAAETVIVVALAIGLSAARSVLSFLRALLSAGGLSASSATLNASQAPSQPWIDLGFQLVYVASLLLPVALVGYLVLRSGDRLRDIGLRVDRLGRDALLGVGAAAAVGGIGLVGYVLARHVGASVNLVPSSLPAVWWALPVLVLSSCANAALEEVVLVGFLCRRLSQLGWSPAVVVAASALLRATYHLYQGASGFLGNLAMGAIFATYFLRAGRVVPLLVAHALIDVVAFVGYQLLQPYLTFL